MPPQAPRQALIFGTFDVSNYGDLLFPIVAAHRLAPMGWSVVPVSPTMQRTMFEDAVPAEPIGQFPNLPPADAVLIGGGEIVHAWPANFLREYRIGDLPSWAYPALWLGATIIAALADLPIVWNAPGVPSPFPEQPRQLAVEPAIAAADYVAVRDATSRRFLGSAQQASIAVVPDTIADLSTVWPRRTLEPVFHALLNRSGAPAEIAPLAVHVRPVALDRGGAAALAAQIGAFASARGLMPILIAIGPSLDDGVALRALSAALPQPHICLDTPRSLREIAAAIAFSRAYLGNSMHGYVTALSYGVPGVIVARPAFRKFAGFAGHAGRPHDVAAGWDDGLHRLAECIGTPVHIPSSVTAALDQHWSRVHAAIETPAPGRQRRADFLRHFLSGGIEASGFGWALQPLGARRAVPRS